MTRIRKDQTTDEFGEQPTDQGERKMIKLPKFRKTAEVVDHVLTAHGIEVVLSEFGETLYITAFDESTNENIIVTAGSKALKAQLSGIDDLNGTRVIIRKRGQSYEIQEAEL